MGALAVEIAPHMLETCRLFHEGLAATGACKGGKLAIGCRCRDGGHIGICHSFVCRRPTQLVFCCKASYKAATSEVARSHGDSQLAAAAAAALGPALATQGMVVRAVTAFARLPHQHRPGRADAGATPGHGSLVCLRAQTLLVVAQGDLGRSPRRFPPCRCAARCCCCCCCCC